MRPRTIIAAVATVLVVAIVGVVGWLLLAPPELLRIADGYAAKIICSNVFLANRDAQQVLDVDVTAAGNPVLKFIKQSVDRDAGTVTARMLGFVAPMTAVYRAGLGCTLAADGNVDAVRKVALATPPTITPLPDAPWPEGNGASTSDPGIADIIGDPKLSGPGMRAVLVIHDGKIAGETYGEGFDQKTPLLGWSMSKSINAILLGMFIKSGRLGFDDTGLFPEWKNDGRKDIKLRNLLDMTSGLAFNEDYGDVTDVTRMLYLEPDMSGFAAAQPLLHPPGTVFSYSTGTAMMLSRIWMNKLPLETMALGVPRMVLFGPLGMTSAVFEPDEGGTLAGGSYVYATARDWARVGQFLLDGGKLDGQQVLPEGFIQMMETSNGKPGGYTQLQTWLEGPTETDTKSYGLPKDTFWFSGHDGQSMAIIPSQNLVVVRLGLTPSNLGWGPEPMVKTLVEAFSP